MPKIRLAVIISTFNRLELLKQTLESLRKHSDSELEIVVVDDVSTDGSKEFLEIQEDIIKFSFAERVTIAEVKKKGFDLVSETEYVYFSDNDAYFEEHWDSKLIRVLQEFKDIGVVGGRKHPHHQLFETRLFEDGQILICEQQAGYSIMMRRKDYLAIGGYEVSEKTKNGGEDTLICDMIKEKGLLIASVDPPVIIHCGMKNWQGHWTADYPEMQKLTLLRPEVKFL